MRPGKLRQALLLLAVLLPAAAHSAEPAKLRFLTWRDPIEAAFTVSVPEGWSVSGGMRRAGPIDPRALVDVRALDGTLREFLGDVDVGLYQVPDPFRIQMGFREGQIINNGAAAVTLLRYRTGAQFARGYIGWRLCRAPRILAAAEVPHQSRQLAARMAAANAQFMQNLRMQAQVGEVTFQCGNQGGMVMAGTALASPAVGPGIATWSVPLLAGYVAGDASASELGQYIMHILLATFEYDRDWEARFDGGTRVGRDPTSHELCSAAISSPRSKRTSVRAVARKSRW